MSMSALEARGLSIELAPRSGPRFSIARDIELTVQRGRTLALVGESGCGKSVTALALMNLLSPPLRIAHGSVVLQGREGAFDVTAHQPESEAMRRVRGRRIAMIFQDPLTSLDPVYTVGDQIGQALRIHLGLSRRAALERTLELLRLVGIPDPARRARQYPFEFSGGMRQRVMIAIAIACEPDILIADEPTTALDVTVQAQILELLHDLRERLGMAILLITHDLGVVAENADELAVMYRGAIVERGPVAAVFAAPSHPYTRGLLASLPPLDGEPQRLRPIKGFVPPLGAQVPGCPFEDRCPLAVDICRERFPPDVTIGGGHSAACWRTDAREAAA